MVKAWEHIVDDVLYEIKKQSYKPQEKLPSEHALCERYKTTRIEVRRALSTLRDLGYIYSQQGKGYFFNGKQEKIRLRLRNDTSFSKKLSFLKERFHTSVIDCTLVQCDEHLAKKMQLAIHEPIYRIRRLRLIDQIPSAMHISYISKKEFPNVQERLQDNPSLYEYFLSQNVADMKCDHISFSISNLNHEERSLMRASGIIPCMVLTSYNYHVKTQRVVEYTKIIYRGDRFIFEI